MRYLPKLQQLRIFNEIVKHGSIHAAAKSLHLSQPALTYSMRELEQTLDATLMIRSHDGIVLTEAGQTFSSYSLYIIQELERATIDIISINNKVESTVSFGMSSLLAVTILSSVIKDFKKYNDTTKIIIKEAQLSTLLPCLREGMLEFAVGTVSDNMLLNNYNVDLLFDAPFSIVARKDHPLVKSTSLEQLKDAKWLFPETNMGYYNSLYHSSIIDFNKSKNKPIFSDSSVCILNMVIKDDYLTILSKARLAQPEFRDVLVPLQIKELLPCAQYGLIYLRNHPLSAPARKLIDIIKYHCKTYNWSPDDI
ncbi:MAG: LysR family transcriptional regulator [Citrobacter sp.]|uniref:LysR family transcriptional regulator n=1 Tax=Citrobacter sp. TaxID=1896336 RepID=UPI002FC5B740